MANMIGDRVGRGLSLGSYTKQVDEFFGNPSTTSTEPRSITIVPGKSGKSGEQGANGIKKDGSAVKSRTRSKLSDTQGAVKARECRARKKKHRGNI